MYSQEELCMHSLKCYFSVYFEINTEITLSRGHNPFTIQVYTLFYINLYYKHCASEIKLFLYIMGLVQHCSIPSWSI